MRITKTHEERRNEILDEAETLFITKGYLKTTVNDILKGVGIAKGTFYYYFKSKEEVMNAIVLRIVSSGVAAAKEIANNNNLTVHEKFLKIIMAQKPTTNVKKEMINQLHQIKNAEMHHKSLVETIKQLTPVLVEVLLQGKKEGLFHTPYPKEAIEFFLVASTFLFDDELFDWQEDEINHKIQAFIYIMEVISGAEIGSFAYLIKAFGEVPIEGEEIENM
ncbi:TetR/AcrR family transcriptional regulator [Mycoplasmatota bacterium]|nr:TetR/AcrR family transcriptional regulator [Mycoplasmatota bacterium]